MKKLGITILVLLGAVRFAKMRSRFAGIEWSGAWADHGSQSRFRRKVSV